MQNVTNRQVLDQELMRYTAAGWQIISQSETAFQVMLPHTVSGPAVAILVIAPLALGILAALVSTAFGSAFFSLALVFAALLVLDHLTKRPKLLYITAEQLRNKPTEAESAARVVPNGANGGYVCSSCGGSVRTDATECKHCHKPMFTPAATYVGIGKGQQ